MEKISISQPSSPPSLSGGDSADEAYDSHSSAGLATGPSGVGSQPASAPSTPDRIRRRLSHNPSPPPELLAAGVSATGDAIGDTLYSERWVLQTLMELSKLVEDKSLGATTDDDDDSAEELNGEVETTLCQLWDMTANKDVVLFLLGLPTLDMIAEAMTRTKFPRLLEIAAGIVANMACVPEACHKLTEHEKLKTATLRLLDVSDPPTLAEVFRILLTCTQSKAHSITWLNLYREDNHFLPHLTFIMASSTNTHLLKIAGEFVDYVLDAGEDFCSDWASMEFVDSLIEAMRQVGFINKDTVETYLHVLHLLSTSEKGKLALVHHSGPVIKMASRYIAVLCDEDCIDIVGHELGLGSAILLVGVLLTTSSDSIIHLLKQEKSLRFVTKLTKAFSPSPTSDGISVKLELAQHLRTQLEEDVVSLLEQLIGSDEGTDLLIAELNEQDESITEAFLAWAESLEESSQLSRRLFQAVTQKHHNHLAQIFLKVMRAKEPKSATT